ncbi:AMP-binding protein [Pseudaquabacterium terrae]|uniref:AMP-binding protein n=1 Tax=Pseudaquabacterium terrae TaxID=2732868 RepID=UPI003CCE1FF7
MDRPSFADLDRQARGLGTLLQSDPGLAGQRVLLIFPPGLDFVVAFVGCLYGGAVPVPMSPPRRDQGVDKLRAIGLSCVPKALLTDRAADGDCTGLLGSRNGGRQGVCRYRRVARRSQEPRLLSSYRR